MKRILAADHCVSQIDAAASAIEAEGLGMEPGSLVKEFRSRRDALDAYEREGDPY